MVRTVLRPAVQVLGAGAKGAFSGECWANLRNLPALYPISQISRLPVGPGTPGPTGLWGNE